ncbi:MULTISPECIES: hypothetical protein [Nocardia]|uniref:Uncharacterized protein n=1 Tax=Nocardia nova TaxID=37330 RepID=A0A2T2YT60_9NOCA|nr:MULTISPECIES: hypothetical protein [Nocardia]PSR58687.1 hypothetical protein C8259_29540 [Nocardia nova]
MSEPNREVTLAIRIDTARHTQLTWIADLRKRSLKAECFAAVDAWIEAAKNDPDLMARANAARAAIEEEARTRQAAINNLFTATPPPPPDDEDTAVVIPEEAEPATEAADATEVTDTTEDAPAQGARRSRGRRGSQQAGGEQTDS